jgi:plastin-1
VRPQDISSGSSKLNLCFAAAVFNTNHGLHASEAELFEAAALMNDDVEGTREERAFRMWLNSLNLEDVYVNNLYEDVKSGTFILKALEKVTPESVTWSRVEKNPTNKFKKLSNCNMVIELGRGLKFHLVNISGNDLVDGNKKLVLAYMWQLIRHAIL